jgi:hypothetical protein
MSNIAKLGHTLTAIDQAALSVILEPQSEERRAALCVLIREHGPVMAEEYPLGDIEIWRKKILGVAEEVVATATRQDGWDRGRLGLIVSYIRTMRGFIAKALAALP